MNKEISTFIKENKIASMAGVDEHHKPFCFNCFYVYDGQHQLLFFKSSPKTHHAKWLLNDAAIAGSILPDKINFLALKGIQFTGVVLTQNIPDNIVPEVYYHKKIPLALAKAGHVWCIQLHMIKMTDNTPILGGKLLWNKA